MNWSDAKGDITMPRSILAFVLFQSGQKRTIPVIFQVLVSKVFTRAIFVQAEIGTDLEAVPAGARPTSHREIAAWCGCNKDRIKQALDALKEWGLIKVRSVRRDYGWVRDPMKKAGTVIFIQDFLRYQRWKILEKGLYGNPGLLEYSNKETGTLSNPLGINAACRNIAIMESGGEGTEINEKRTPIEEIRAMVDSIFPEAPMFR